MKLRAFQAFCTVLTWSGQLKSLCRIIPKYLQLLASGILWFPKTQFRRSFTRVLVKLTALLLPGFISIAFSTAYCPSLSRSICNVSMSLSCMIFLRILQLSTKSLRVYCVPPNIIYVREEQKWGQQASLWYPWRYSDFLILLPPYSNTLWTTIRPRPYDYPRIHSRGRNFHNQPIIRI